MSSSCVDALSNELLFFISLISLIAADASAPDATASQDDVSRIIRIIRDRDERIAVAEVELGALKDDLKRMTEENRRLREDILPLIRIEKDRFHPLPNPTAENGDNMISPPAQLAERGGTGLSRKFSNKKLWTAPKIPSPTNYPNQDSSNIDISSAGLSAKHLGTSIMGSGQPQISPGQPSPSPPPYDMIPRSDGPGWQYQNGDDSSSFHRYPDSTYNDRGQRSQQNLGPTRSGRLGANPLSVAQSIDQNASAASSVLSLPGGRDVNGTTNNTTIHLPNGAGSNGTKGSGLSSAGSINGANPPNSGSGSGAAAPPNNPFKKFRVSVDDPCHKVLPVALKQYKIAADWRQYSLYIVHGDQERCLGLNEKPLILFKQLDKEGRKPMFMLRKHAAPAEGHINTVTGMAGNGSVATAGSSLPVQIPGGVL